MTRTFPEDNNTVSGDLAIVPGTLRCVTYDVTNVYWRSRHFMQYKQQAVALYTEGPSIQAFLPAKHVPD